MTRVTCEIFTNPMRSPKFVGTNASQLWWFHVQVVTESTWYVLEDLDENSWLHGTRLDVKAATYPSIGSTAVDKERMTP